MLVFYLKKIKLAEWKNDTDKAQLLEFRKEVIERTTGPPWNSDFAKRTNKTVSSHISLKTNTTRNPQVGCVA